ncbi:right-handed parallel beta-helix repeat-containing protein [Arenibaculum pallidiluteum]|uniref:right-handed parallel beta-helix repeat-containing protein n=1 Tax=Arenibaculum pallidiluteum TaxID=2812559 RepID=UPI001A9751A8|nr:right-handed parallel beta-helix repeat-containing protein [Arenibaculum pallidiluteum]
MAYNPLSISPLADGYVPWDGAKPTKYLWVSPKGSNSNSGSEGSPLKTIQAAVEKAAPGTAIMVKAGTYNESVQLTKDGSSSKPIWLTSADGEGAAKIVSSSGSKGPIYAHGEDNWVIKGFAIQGGKNGIQFSMSGNNLNSMGSQGLAKNVVIQDNVITSAKEDGIKLSQAQNFVVVGNTVKNGASQEGLDNVYTTNSVFAYNTFKDLKGLSAITVKGASSDIDVHHNFIDGIKADGIVVGGWSTNAGTLFPKSGYEARDIDVHNNAIQDVGKRAVTVLSGWDSEVRDNKFDPQGDYMTVAHVDKDNLGWISKNVHFADNITSRSDWLSIGGGSKNVTQSGNDADGSWSVRAGADHPPGGGGASASTAEVLSAELEPAAAPAEAEEESAPQNDAPQNDATQGSWKDSAAWTSTLHGASSQGKVDTLNGTGAHELLDGRSGADRMIGGGGDDTYVVGHPLDAVIEKAGGGTDTVLIHTPGWTLPAQVENIEIRLAGGTAAVTDNTLDNVLVAQDRSQDLFHFVEDNGHDRVDGFEVGQDRIELDGITQSEITVQHRDGNLILDLPGDNSITLTGLGSSVGLLDILN